MNAARSEGIPVVLILSEPDRSVRQLLGCGARADPACELAMEQILGGADLVLGYGADRDGRAEDPAAGKPSQIYLPEALVHTLHSAQRMRLAGTMSHSLPLDWVRRHKRRFASALLGHDTPDGRRSAALRALQAAFEDAGGPSRGKALAAGDWEWAALPAAGAQGRSPHSLLSAGQALHGGRWQRPREGDVAAAIEARGLPRDRSALGPGLRRRWATRMARGALLGEEATAPGRGYAPLAPAVDAPSAYQRTWPSIGQRAWHKDAFVRGRAFDVAIESSLWDRAYVSEKVLDSAFAGAIPVYSGGQLPPFPRLLRGDRLLQLRWDDGQAGRAAGEEEVRRAAGALWKDREGALLRALQMPVFQPGGQEWLCSRMKRLSGALASLLRRSEPLLRRVQAGGAGVLGDSRWPGVGGVLGDSRWPGVGGAAGGLLGGEVGPPPAGWDAPLVQEVVPPCFGPGCARLQMQPMPEEARAARRAEGFAFRVLHGAGRSALH